MAISKGQADVDAEVHEMVRQAGWGGGILSHIQQNDVTVLAALHAPYGVDARDAYFAEMRALADKQAPCTYQRYGQPVSLAIKVVPCGEVRVQYDEVRVQCANVYQPYKQGSREDLPREYRDC